MPPWGSPEIMPLWYEHDVRLTSLRSIEALLTGSHAAEADYEIELHYVGLNLKNQSRRSEKFWRVLFVNGLLRVSWGKLGTIGQGKVYTPEEDGAKLFDALKRKLDKGYVLTALKTTGGVQAVLGEPAPAFAAVHYEETWAEKRARLIVDLEKDA